MGQARKGKWAPMRDPTQAGPPGRSDRLRALQHLVYSGAVLRLFPMLAACLALLTPGTAPLAQPKPEPAPASSIRLVIDGEPAHLNPLLDPDLWGHRLTHDLVCEPLLRRLDSPQGPRYEGVLAERFRLDRDGRGLDLWLRKGVRFHDGRPLSAYDVQLSLQMVLASEHSAPQTRGLLRDVARVVMTGRDSLHLDLRRGSGQILDALAELSIVPAAHFPDGRLTQKPWNRKPVCTGPYRLVEWKRGSHLTLRQFAGYWGPPPRTEELRILFAPDAARGLQLLRNGQAEGLLRVPLRYLPDLIQPAVERGRWHKLELPASQLVALVWNGRHPLLGQAAVRRALAGLLDRGKLLRDARLGLGSLEVLWPAQGKLSLDEAGVQLDAVQLTRAAPGSLRLWQGRPLALKLLLPQGSAELLDLATRIIETLTPVGIKVEAEPVELSALLGRLRRGAFDLALTGWGWTGSDRLFDPEPLLRLAYPDSHPLWQTLTGKLAEWHHGGDPQPLGEVWQREEPLTLLYRPRQLLVHQPGLRLPPRADFVDLRAAHLTTP